MKTRRLIGLFGIATLAFFLSGFGTQAVGQNLYWIGGFFAPSWNNGSCWSTTPGGFPAYAIPTATTNVYIRTSGISIPVNQGVCASLTIGTATASADITLTPTSTSLNIPGLYIGGALTLFSRSSINIGPKSATTDVSIWVGGNVTLHSGIWSSNLFSIDPTQIYSSTTPLKKFVFGPASTLTMGTMTGGDLRVTYFGIGVDSWITRSTLFLLTPVHFKDDITLDCEFNPGAYNVWLGMYADINRSTVNNQTQNFITFTSAHIGNYGMIIKDVAYWRVVSTGTFSFPLGTSKIAEILVDVNHAVDLPATSWAIGPTQPFRGVGIRAVNLIHPANGASNKYSYYWIVQGVGLYQDYNDLWYNENGTQEIYWTPLTKPQPFTPQSICYQVAFHPGFIQGSPQNVYAARYSNNWEDVYPLNALGNWYTDGSPIQPVSSSGRVLVYMCPTSGFGDITIGVGNDPVPVELTSFSARYLDGSVRLNWQTATELNNFGFAIERSVDGESWEDVGFVEGNGTSFSPKQYEYTDRLTDNLTRLPQLAYRLRQMDRDGTTDYSNIVFVKTGEMPSGIELYAAYPNPFNPATTVSFTISEPSNVTLKIYNALGQVVVTLLAGSDMDAGLHTVPFNGDQLPSGIYMAVLEANGAQQHQKLVLNK